MVYVGQSLVTGFLFRDNREKDIWNYNYNNYNYNLLFLFFLLFFFFFISKRHGTSRQNIALAPYMLCLF